MFNLTFNFTENSFPDKSTLYSIIASAVAFDRITVYSTLRTPRTDKGTENFVKSQVCILEAKILRWTDQMLIKCDAHIAVYFRYFSVSMNR